MGTVSGDTELPLHGCHALLALVRGPDGIKAPPRVPCHPHPVRPGDLREQLAEGQAHLGSVWGCSAGLQKPPGVLHSPHLSDKVTLCWPKHGVGRGVFSACPAHCPSPATLPEQGSAYLRPLDYQRGGAEAGRALLASPAHQSCPPPGFAL